MPYIKQDDYLRAADDPQTPGELNYNLTCLAIAVFLDRIDITEFDARVGQQVSEYLHREPSYTLFNEVVGALVCCGQELLRRMRGTAREAAAQRCSITLANHVTMLYKNMIAPYEDIKIAENGDVFPEELFPPKEDDDDVS